MRLCNVKRRPVNVRSSPQSAAPAMPWILNSAITSQAGAAAAAAARRWRSSGNSNLWQPVMTSKTSSNGGASTSGQAPPAEEWNVTHAGQARAAQQPHRSDLAVVLVQPQIPQNTGNIARTCAATNVALHLVGPLGFEISDKQLKRAGLDYWDNLAVALHDSWEAFFGRWQGLPGPKRLVGFSVYGSEYYAGPEFEYLPGDHLLFGAETTGLPLQAHTDIVASGGRLVKIPIVDTFVRSLNQSVCVGVGVFEALRQLDAGRQAVAPRDDATNAMVRLPTPMMMHAALSQEQQRQADCSSSQETAATAGAAVEGARSAR